MFRSVQRVPFRLALRARCSAAQHFPSPRAFVRIGPEWSGRSEKGAGSFRGSTSPADPHTAANSEAGHAFLEAESPMQRRGHILRLFGFTLFSRILTTLFWLFAAAATPEREALFGCTEAGRGQVQLLFVQVQIRVETGNIPDSALPVATRPDLTRRGVHRTAQGKPGSGRQSSQGWNLPVPVPLPPPD